MPSLLQTYDALFRSAFESAGFPPELGAIRESDKPDLPPFQCNGVMAAAGFLKKKVRQPWFLVEDIDLLHRSCLPLSGNCIDSLQGKIQTSEK